MQEAIVIQIDLETKEAETFKKVEDASKDLGNAISKNVSGKLSEAVAKSAENTAKSLKGVEEATKKVGKSSQNATNEFTKLNSQIVKISTLGGFLEPVINGTREALLTLTRLRVGFNTLSQALGDTSQLASLALGAIVVKLASLGGKLGEVLIGFFQRATVASEEFDDSVKILVAAIDSINRSLGKSVISADAWIEKVDEAARKFNINSKDILKSSQNIILVGSKLGLTSDQLERLIEISAEYAKINKKDIVQTSDSLIAALNGQAKSAQFLGVRLGNTAVQQFAYSQGITKSIQKMSEAEVVQLRYNKLLENYSEIAGLGVIAANELSDQQVRLEQNQKRVIEALGDGAKLIENNGIVAFALNKIIESLNTNVIRAAGFLGALGARALDFGSLVVGLTGKVFLLVQGFTTLNQLLSSKFGEALFTTTIPVINKSLDELVAHLTDSTIKVRTLSDAMTALGLITKKNLATSLAYISTEWKKSNGVVSTVESGISKLKDTMTKLAGFIPSISSIFTFFTGALSKLRVGLTVILGLAKSLFLAFTPLILPLVKLGAIIALIVAPFYVLYRAFLIIEGRTKVLSTLWAALKEVISATGSALEPAKTAFNSFKDTLIEVASKGFGYFVDGIAKLVGYVLSIAKDNPFGVFSNKTIKSLEKVNEKLGTFRKELEKASYDIRKIASDTGKSVADSLKNSINLDELARQLDQVKSSLENAGLTQEQIIKKTAENQRKIIKQALDNNLLDRKDYSDLLIKIALEEKAKLEAIEKEKAKSTRDYVKEINDSIVNGLIQVTSAAFQSLGKSLVDSGDDFKGFLGTVLNILGDLAISIGTTIIAASEAIRALRESLLDPTAGARAVVIGGALIAIGAALKVFGSKFGGGKSTSIPNGSNTGIGGGIAGGTVADNSVAQAPDEARRTNNTQVQLIVQGDVLDSQETGTRIAKILSDAFQKDGIVLNNGAVS